MSDAIEQDDGSFLNDTGATVNAENHLIDDEGALINDDGYLVNETGQLLNATGEAVDADGNLVDEDNKLIDSGDDDDKGKGHMIPKERYDTAARRATDAEDALAKANAKLAEQDTASGGDPKNEADYIAEIDALDAKIENARKDGNVDEVVKLNKEQRDLERVMYSAIAANHANNAGTKAQQKVALDTMITELESTHDFFNPNSKKFDQVLVDEVIDLQHAFVAKGDTPASAMAKAVGYVIPASKEPGGSRDTDRDKNLDAGKRQAPKLGKDGRGSDAGGDTGDVGDVGKMTTEEFDALPSTTKKRMRGDAYAGA